MPGLLRFRRVRRLATIPLLLVLSCTRLAQFNGSLRETSFRRTLLYEDVSASVSSYWINNQQSAGSGTINLVDLANTYPETKCPDGLYLMEDKWIDPTLVYNHDRHIPRIIHVTGKSRCVSESIRHNLETHWRNYPDHAFVFYNDAAVDRLLNRHFDEFPHLQQVLQCVRSGAAKADVFRALVVWEYGGIYTDMDNAANNFNASTTIEADDEAFFVLESAKLLSQFFFATNPKHPIMFLLVQSMLQRLLALNEVDRQYVPFVTGPGALKQAFVHYMGAQGQNDPRNADHTSPYHNPEKEGVYRGLGNTTVTIKGHPRRSTLYIRRRGIPDKLDAYAQMNMTHFSQMGLTGSNESCMNRIYLRQIAETATTDYTALAKW